MKLVIDRVLNVNGSAPASPFQHAIGPHAGTPVGNAHIGTGQTPASHRPHPSPSRVCKPQSRTGHMRFVRVPAFLARFGSVRHGCSE